MPPSRKLDISRKDRRILQSWASVKDMDARYKERASIILALGRGIPNKQVAADLQTREARVCKWRKRYESEGISGLSDLPRSGKPSKYSGRDEEKVLQQLKIPSLVDDPGIWNGKTLSKALKGISKDHIWKIARKHRISLQRNHYWRVITETTFISQAIEVLGLYIHKEVKALAIGVGVEVSSRWAGKEMGRLLLPGRQDIKSYYQQYQQRGTLSLHDALQIAIKDIGKRKPYKGRRSFLDFMSDLKVVRGDAKPMHIIINDPTIHISTIGNWRHRNPSIQFHAAGPDISWVTMIGIFCNMLFDSQLGGAKDKMDLMASIDQYMLACGKASYAFEWLAIKLR